MDAGHTLLIRPGALGDAVLTLPVLHALRISGAAKLTVLGTPASWGFIKPAAGGRRVLDFSSADWLGIVSEAVPLSPAARTALAGVGMALVYLNDAALTARVLTRAGVQEVVCAVPPISGTLGPHAAQRLLKPLRALIGDQAPDEALAMDEQAADEFLAVDEGERAAALGGVGLSAPPPGGFFGVHPGSGGRRKCWPAENFARVAAELARRGLSPLVFFGPADDAVWREFDAAMPSGVAWTRAANRPLREVLALLTLCRGYLGNDSGVTHLAARACPVVALFGPTAPEIWAPLGRDVRILQAPERNLSKLGPAAVLEAALGSFRS